MTMPVLPPLVVTRMDCESRMHTVFNSCLGSVFFMGWGGAALEGDPRFGVTPGGVLVWGLQIGIVLNPDVFRLPCC